LYILSLFLVIGRVIGTASLVAILGSLACGPQENGSESAASDFQVSSQVSQVPADGLDPQASSGPIPEEDISARIERVNEYSKGKLIEGSGENRPIQVSLSYNGSSYVGKNASLFVQTASLGHGVFFSFYPYCGLDVVAVFYEHEDVES